MDLLCVYIILSTFCPALLLLSESVRETILNVFLCLGEEKPKQDNEKRGSKQDKDVLPNLSPSIKVLKELLACFMGIVVIMPISVPI